MPFAVRKLCCLWGLILASSVHASPALPTGFMENRGQFDERVLYYTPNAGAAVYVLKDAIVIDFARADADRDRVTGHALWLTFDTPATGSCVTARSPLPGLYNFLIGSDPEDWRTGVRTFEEVCFEFPADRAGLAFQARTGGLTYSLAQLPEEAAQVPRIHCQGAPCSWSLPDGGFHVETALGSVTHLPPGPGEAAGLIRIESAGTAPESAMAEARDSAALSWGSYLGAGGVEYGHAVALDAAGCSLVMGDTESPGFPTTPGAYDRLFEGEREVFVSKFSTDGSALEWSTFLGGNYSEHGDGSLLVDDAGDVIIAGRTISTTFPHTPSAFDTSYNGYGDVFVTKLHGDGGQIYWSTYLGGELSDQCADLALDQEGNPIVVGITSSLDFPTTPGAYQTSHAGGLDAYITKLHRSGGSLIWSTLLGGPQYEYPNGLALVADEDVLVCGLTSSPTFPTTPAAWDPTFNGGTDGFVCRLSATGDALLWSTFLGASGDDELRDIAPDAFGRPLVAGETWSPDFPVTLGAFDETFGGGGADACLTLLDEEGGSLVWSTLLGGGGLDHIETVKLDTHGDAVLAGWTQSADFPTTENAFDEVHNGNFDGIVSVLTADGRWLAWSSFLGGNSIDYASDMSLDAEGCAVVVGTTISTNFPTTPGAYDRTHNGGSDAFACRLDVSAAAGVPDADGRPGDPRALRIPCPYAAHAPIACELPAPTDVEIRIADAAGRLVRALPAGRQSAGSFAWSWDGLDGSRRPAGAGLYFVTLRAGGSSWEGRLLLLP